MTGSGVTLIGDGIENPGNALAMIHAAEMYGVRCSFRDTKGLGGSELLRVALDGHLSTITHHELVATHSRIIAFDNLPGAAEVYGYKPGSEFAVLVGNEKRGLSNRSRDLSTEAVHIPMLSLRINCLNVAAASAVALHYLHHVRVGSMATRRNPENRRPELLLVGGADHIELGSAIRSAAAFGWRRALIEDREKIWFGCDRVKRSEGRAAARRGRNAIRLSPCLSSGRHDFRNVTVVTTQPIGIPLHRANLARGPQQLIVFPDESCVSVEDEAWDRLGREIQFAHLDVTANKSTYHFRLSSTVVLAEISRQVGRRFPKARGELRPTPIYDRTLDIIAETAGEEIWLEDLQDF